jgi:hypothetical protein
MADMITGTTTGFVNNLPDNTLTAVQSTKDAIKDARYDINATTAAGFADLSRQTDAIDDTLTAMIHQVSRDTTDLRAQVISAQQFNQAAFQTAAKDSEINSLKTQIELAKQSTYLSDKIDEGNAATRALINDLRDRELNRVLVERNAEILEERDGRRHWRGAYDQGQWAALSSQLQAFQSQLQETRQGVTNFGTMTGNAGRQQATNNVA